MSYKSVFFTYILWFFGGIFGLHHFYLGRDYHALVWWMTLGGYFGIGWLRELWRIPEYVRDANSDPTYMAKLSEEMRKSEKPPTGTVRYFGQMMIADLLAFLAVSAVPRELVPVKYLPVISAFVGPLASAFGIYIVGNIGRHEGRLYASLIGAYVTSPLYFFMDLPVFWTSLLSAYIFNTYSKKWRRTPLRKPFLHRITFLALCGSIYLLLWGSLLYFNCKVTYQNEEEVKCRDAAKHFFRSPMWKEFVTVMKEVIHGIQEYGWREVWNQIVEAFDPIGEVNALKVLGLNAKATQQEITARYRKLSREWHPDKHKNLEDKKIAEEKFIEIQQAYEILSKIKSQRVSQNTKSPVTERSHSDVEL